MSLIRKIKNYFKNKGNSFNYKINKDLNKNILDLFGKKYFNIKNLDQSHFTNKELYFLSSNYSAVADMNNKPIARNYNQLYTISSFVSPVTPLIPTSPIAIVQPTRDLNTIIKDIKTDQISFEQDFGLDSRNYGTQTKSLDNVLGAIKNTRYEKGKLNFRTGIKYVGDESQVPLAKYEQTLVAIDNWLDNLCLEDAPNYLRKDHLFGGTIEISNARKEDFKDNILNSLFSKKQKKNFVKLSNEKANKIIKDLGVLDTETREYILSKIDKFEENTLNWDRQTLLNLAIQLDNDSNISQEAKEYFSQRFTHIPKYQLKGTNNPYNGELTTLGGCVVNYLKEKKKANSINKKFLGDKKITLYDNIVNLFSTHIYKTGENPTDMKNKYDSALDQLNGDDQRNRLKKILKGHKTQNTDKARSLISKWMDDNYKSIYTSSEGVEPDKAEMNKSVEEKIKNIHRFYSKTNIDGTITQGYSREVFESANEFFGLHKVNTLLKDFKPSIYSKTVNKIKSLFGKN